VPKLSRAASLSWLSGLALVAGFGLAAPVSADEPPFVPALAEEFADPFVLTLDDGWVAYATNDRFKNNVPMAMTTNLVDWQIVPGADGKGRRDALPDLPGWAKKGWTWAPEVLRTDKGYILYFTAKENKSDLQCVGAATSNNPLGPFVASSAEPLICQKDLGGTIDADPFRDADGQLYLYFKNDGNAVRKPAQVWVQKLSPDGLSLSGPVTPLLSADKGWENGVVEAPSMVRQDGKYFLFYSGSYFGWNADQRLSPYAMGYATCAGPVGPCDDSPDNPILHSFSGKEGCLSGPGHQAVFEAAGRTFLAFHAWAATPGCRPLDPERYLYVSPLLWKDGKPAIGISVRAKKG
jgi:beta-xylosidase